MDKKVICYIQAFDCEHTIEAAMQSILDQTYENWLCFVLSNGNKNTVEAPNWSFDVIRNIAARDSRFVVLNKKDNNIDMYIPMLYHLANSFPDSYVCSLDADDVYQKDFFERAVTWAEKEHLDIVACGTDIVQKKAVNSKEEVLLRRRMVEQDMIVRAEDFSRQFRIYKPFFNEMWGKLYRSELFGAKFNERYARKKFFWRFLLDTLFTIDNLSRSKAVGILSGTSHKFYQYEQRNATNATVLANAYAANRRGMKRAINGGEFSIYATYETVMSFLRAHGEIDSSLYEYMQAVLFGWFGDFYARTLLFTTNEAKLAKHIEGLVYDPKFDELMAYQGSGAYNNLRDYEQRKAFCEKIKHLLIGQKAIRNRSLGKIGNLKCMPWTQKRMDRLIAKLNSTIQMLAQKE